MRPKRNDSTHDQPQEPYRGEEYHFDSDAAWCKPEYTNHDLTGFIVFLCRKRRTSMASPSELASSITASRHADSFNAQNMAQWATLTTHDQWPLAQTSRSGERVIVDGGYGMGGVNRLAARTEDNNAALLPEADEF